MQERVVERDTCCVRCGRRLRSRVPTPVCYDCRSDRWFLDRIGVDHPLPSHRTESAT